VFPVLALYLWAVVAWDVVGWPAQSSAGHAAVDG
jgi:hypothetical protein